MLDALTDAIGNPYILVALVTLLPFLELRASIPYGIVVLGKDHWPAVFAIAVVVNILLGPVLYVCLDKLLHLFLRIPAIRRLWERIVVRTQKRVQPKVERYGVWGLGFFIGVPLPGSGVYSGSIGGYLLGFSHRKFFFATVIGVLIAGAAVTAVVLSGVEALSFLVKDVPPA